MKITDVEALVLRSPRVDGRLPTWSEDNLVIRVHTDEGIVGIGEVDSAPWVVRAVVEAPSSQPVVSGLRELLLGENPLDIDRLWSKMYRGVIYYGRRGAAIHAISGVDMALWDIKGKALSKPICDLIGTPVRKRVRAYASLIIPDTVGEVIERVAALKELGFTAIKFAWGSIGSRPQHDILRARAARDAGGAEVDILIDAGFGYAGSVATAITVARELEELGVFWLEEPFEPDDYEAYAQLADSVELRIAAGEQEATVWGFRELIERGHLDVVQPDAGRCGGITETLRIAAFASSRGVATVLHAWKSGILKAASLHVSAVLPEALFLEYSVSELPLYSNLTRERLPIGADGCVAVPTGPGLGVALDDEILQRYLVADVPNLR